MVNQKEINEVRKIIFKSKEGLHITPIVEESKLKRCQVRIALAFLLGSKEIEERKIGMSKLYTKIK